MRLMWVMVLDVKLNEAHERGLLGNLPKNLKKSLIRMD